MSFKANSSNDDYLYPLIILINEGSASASEIVAGAIQDHKRGLIIGTRSFGKGSVQTIIPLPGGAGLRVTTARYFTPDGNSIQALGITPDVEVPFAPCTTQGEEVEQKPKLRESDLKNHILADEHDGQPEQSEEQTNDHSERLEQDNQLRTALNILKSINLYTQFQSQQ